MAAVPIKAIADKASEICKIHGAYLYDIMYVKEGPKKVLRIFVDTSDGIGIDLCEKISRDISAFLDDEDLIKEVYSLEVSSPGVERKLRTDEHFLAVVGKKVSLSLYSPIDGQKNFMGILESYSDNIVTLKTEKENLSFTKDKIADAHLYFDINEFLNSQK